MVSAALPKVDGDGQQRQGGQDLVGAAEELPQEKTRRFPVDFVEGKKADRSGGQQGGEVTVGQERQAQAACDLADVVAQEPGAGIQRGQRKGHGHQGNEGLGPGKGHPQLADEKGRPIDEGPHLFGERAGGRPTLVVGAPGLDGPESGGAGQNGQQAQQRLPDHSAVTDGNRIGFARDLFGGGS